MHKLKISYLFILLLNISFLTAQNKTSSIDLVLTLEQAIEYAKKSSPMTLLGKNQYKRSYWIYRSFKADLLPQISLNFRPFSYNRFIDRQFVPNESVFAYFEQSSLTSEFVLNATQDLSLTGGRLFFRSNFTRLENFGDRKNLAFNSAPVLFGIQQPLFSFNTTKWNKAIAEIRLEKSKIDYITAMQEVAIETTTLYFDLLLVQLDLELNEKNYLNAKTLYEIGKKRFELTTLSKADFLTLEIEMIKNKNELNQTKLTHSMAQKRLVMHLDMENTNKIKASIPKKVLVEYIDSEKAIEFSRQFNPEYKKREEQELEANINIERAKKLNGIQANIEASIGLNQQAQKADEFYSNLLDQERVNIGITVPILDWKKRKSEINIATYSKETLINQNKLKFQRLENELLEDTMIFNLQKQILEDASDTSKMSLEVYEINRKRFLLGKLDVNNLIITQNRKDSSLRNYYRAYSDYWRFFYQIRKNTLYDFVLNKSLISDFSDF